MVGDISTAPGAERVVERTLGRFGAVHVLVNNAGISQTDATDTWSATPDTWDRVVQVNLKSVYLCSRATIPSLLDAGGGAIVNVASISASVCIGGSAYAATKGAILSYTRHVAAELASRNVRMNCVSPGFMRTPMSTGERHGLSLEEQEERLEGFRPPGADEAGRLGRRHRQHDPVPRERRGLVHQRPGDRRRRRVSRPMNYETILYEVADRTATITFNRPDRLNAVNLEMTGELRDAYARAEGDDEVWTIIVTGTGRAFCSGSDVEGVPADGKVPHEGRYLSHFREWDAPQEAHAAVPYHGEADRGGGQRDLLRCRPRPGHHRRHRRSPPIGPSSSTRTSASGSSRVARWCGSPARSRSTSRCGWR